MTIRLDEDYYYSCCDWCDTENLVLWVRLHSGAYCGACHRPIGLPDSPHEMVNDRRIETGLC